jgi:hypothetical protein
MALKLTCKLRTRYHLKLATADWLRKLCDHLTTSITSHPEFHSANGTGVVTSPYSEERFMGPLSLVKNDFLATVRVSRRFSFRKDHYRANVRYSPEKREFATLYEEVATVETRARDRRNSRRISRLAAQIRRGCSRSLVDNSQCPWCGCTVRCAFHRSGRIFSVSCPSGHFGRHDETSTPPEWWRDAVIENWLDCDM